MTVFLKNYRLEAAIVGGVILAVIVASFFLASPTFARISNPGSGSSGGSSSSGYPFAVSGNATTTLTQFNSGLTAYASTTIGNGTQTAGLTISGGATTTGNAAFTGFVSINAANPSNLDLLSATSPDNSNFSFYHTGGADIRLKAQDNQARITFSSVGGGNDKNLFIDSDDAGNTRLSILGASGNTGINTASPWTILSVNGGLGATASSTIGDGTAIGGLTISGNATTTATSTVQGNLSIGSSANTNHITLNNGTGKFGDAFASFFTASGLTNTNNAVGNIQPSVTNVWAAQIVDNDTTTGSGPCFGLSDAAPGGNNYTGAICGYRTIGGGAGGLLFATKQSATSGVAPSTVFVIDSTGNLGIGTSTPIANLQVTATSTNATTSLQFGKPGQNKGTCMTYYDAGGTPVYGFIAIGATSFTFTTTKPSGCQN